LLCTGHYQYTFLSIQRAEKKRIEAILSGT
jgi:hypothetical protein